MSTIKQKTQTITLEGGTRIEVRRMKWKSARQFLKQIAAILGKLFEQASSDQRAGGSAKDLQQLATSAIADRLPDLIAGSDELVELLITSSTDLSAEQFEALDLAEAGAIITAALEVNLDSEVKKSFAAAGAAIGGLIPVQGLPTNPASQTQTK